MPFGVFVGDLAMLATEDELKEAFSTFGTVLDARIMRDRITGKSLLYGFVDFESARAATDAIRGMDGVIFKGRALKVNWSKARSSKKADPRITQQTQSRALLDMQNTPLISLFIAFPTMQPGQDVSEDHLRNIFTPLGGMIMDCTIRKNSKKIPFGFIRYRDDEEGMTAAIRAAREFHDTQVHGIRFQCTLSHELQQRLYSGAYHQGASSHQQQSSTAPWTQGQGMTFTNHAGSHDYSGRFVHHAPAWSAPFAPVSPLYGQHQVPNQHPMRAYPHIAGHPHQLPAYPMEPVMTTELTSWHPSGMEHPRGVVLPTQQLSFSPHPNTPPAGTGVDQFPRQDWMGYEHLKGFDPTDYEKQQINPFQKRWG